MLSRLHGKQNLWWATDGHWTKWVSSNRSWQIVPETVVKQKISDERSWMKSSGNLHFNVGLTGGADSVAGTLLASTDCPFTADVALLTLPGGALTLFDVGLLFDCDCASVDVTVVLETCRDPDDLRPLDDPMKILKVCWFKPLGSFSVWDYLNSVNSGCRVTTCEAAAAPSVGFHSADYPAVKFL